MGEYGDTICGAIKQVADAFGWNGNVAVALNLVDVSYTLALVSWDSMPKCAKSWDLDTNFPGMMSVSTKVSTAKDNNLIPLQQNGYIVAGFTMFAFFAICFMHGKFQAGDNYVSTKYTVLLD